MNNAELLERIHPGRRAALKRAILEQALVCFNAQGIEAATIEQVRLAVGTSVGAIYHHFGNKEGLVAALFLTALADQAALRDRYLSSACTAEEGVKALVTSYVDWVVAQPEWARFQFQARFAVEQGAHAEDLATRNRLRNQQLLDWFTHPDRQGQLSTIPPALLPALLIGPADHYCRAWLSGRVEASPALHRDALAEAAWRVVGAERATASARRQ